MWCEDEGCVLSMQNTETDSSQFLLQLLQNSVKQHGTQPAMSRGSPAWPTSHRVVKRSLQRAHRRALTYGFAWYRGRCFSAHDFVGLPPPMTPQRSPKNQMNGATAGFHLHTPRRRFTSVCWNPGGLASHRLDELKQWLSLHKVDVVVLPETRWSFSNEWTDADWIHVHTGSPARGQGVLVMISKRLCQPMQLRWSEIIPGRLVHVRIPTANRYLDVIGCYQHTNRPSADCRHHRSQWWRALDTCLSALPQRNTLLVLGDFNCSLAPIPSLAGSNWYRWNGSLQTGAQHPDSSEFEAVVRQHGLVALNTWNAKTGPTYAKMDHHSRIDFCFTRASMADGEARRAQPLWDAPFVSPSPDGHAPLLCTIPKLWIPAQFSGPTRVSKMQLSRCRQTWLEGHETWDEFSAALTTKFHRHFAQVRTSDSDCIEQLHHIASQTMHETFPVSPCSHGLTHWTSSSGLTKQKWYHRRQLDGKQDGSLSGVFQAWRHWTRYIALSRFQKKQAAQSRKAHMLQVTQQAALAASKHDTYALFQIIQRYSPKVPRRRMQLRTATGTLATPVEELAILKAFVADTWSGPCLPDLSLPTPPGVPFSESELCTAVSKIPVTKSVASPFAPGIVWHVHASVIAHWLYPLLTTWWNKPQPFIPSCWRDGWLLMIPKPKKNTTSPQNLRPLALQEPLGKAVIGLLAQKALSQAMPSLCNWPLWAYMPCRSSLDAILRVSQHCRSVRDLLHSQQLTLHNRAAGVTRYSVCGGIQLFVDLERAFDNVDRSRLFTCLSTLGIDPSIVQLLYCWHVDTQYHVTTGHSCEPVQISKGVRQGCKAAPFLWNCFILTLLRTLMAQTSYEWILACCNIYADDFQIGCVFHSTQELHDVLRIFGLVLHQLHHMGLTVNLSKSAVLLEMTGTNHRAVQTQVRIKTEQGPKVCIPLPDGTVAHIPIVKHMQYLGVMMSYHHFEDLTVQHRIHLSQVAFARLRRWLCSKRGLNLTQRLHLWQTCIFSVMNYGILATGFTARGLQLLQKTIFVMHRQILGDHAYITGRTNIQALLRHRIDLPILQIWKAVDALQFSLAKRAQHIATSDIVAQLDWSHLSHLSQLAQLHMSTGNFDLSCTDPGVEPAAQLAFHCDLCSFATAHAPILRRHYTQVHGHSQYRTVRAPTAQHSMHGLPTCKHCKHDFKSWRNFRIHVERGCPQVHPISVMTSTSRPVPADQALRGRQPLTDADLAHLRSHEFGDRVLTIVSSRHWHHLKGEHAACTYLKDHCVLCGQYVSRTQALNAHLRTDHAIYWDHVPTKGTQLTNLYANESPCDYCGFIFKSQHMCPVFTQMALLLVHGGGLPSADTSQSTDPALTCDICHEWFPSAAALQRHLTKDHGLMIWDWNPSRDTVAGKPTCAHCKSNHTSLEGLRNHIMSGHCKAFDPLAPTDTKDILPVWTNACTNGALLQTLADRDLRLELTLRCQCCDRVYTRSKDLAAHLQTAHGGIWTQAANLTQVLVSALFGKLGCICNPAISATRCLDHVCLPFRQLAMQYCRMSQGPFWPIAVSDTDLLAVLSSGLSRDKRFALEQLLASGHLQSLTNDAQILHILRTTCLECNALLSAAELNAHVRAVHTRDNATVQFYLQDFTQVFLQTFANDFQCPACLMIFQHTDVTVGTPASRQASVHQHLLSQCPCVLQAAALLSKALHGGTLAGQHGRGRLISASGSFPGTGPSPSGCGPAAGTQSKRCQEKEDPPAPAGKRQRSKPAGHAAHQTAATHGHTGDQARPRAEHHADSRHLRALFQQGAKRGPANPDEGSQCLAPTDTGKDSSSTGLPPATLGCDHAPGSAGTSHQDLPVQQGRCAPQEGVGITPDLGGWQLAISPMWLSEASASDITQEAHQHGQNARALHGTAGDVQGPAGDLEIPRPEDADTGQGCPLETSAESQARCTLRSAVPDVSQQCMASSWDITQATSPAPKHIGDPVAEAHGTVPAQGQGQRERQEQRPALSQDRDLTALTRAELMTSLAHLCLLNGGNWCYANSTFLSCLWTMLTMDAFELAHWGQHAATLVSFLRSPVQLKSLIDEPWFTQVLQPWGDMNLSASAQQDMAEFLMIFMRWLQPHGVHLHWERRFEEQGQVTVADYSHECLPIGLHLDPTHGTTDFDRAISIQTLIDNWSKVHGMKTGLLCHSQILCFHLDRWTENHDGRPVKCQIPVDVMCDSYVPVFPTQTLETERIPYTTVAVTAHFGTDQAGHYRAALRLAPGAIGHTPLRWLVTEDGAAPLPVWDLPSWFVQNISVIWMVRDDVLGMHHLTVLPTMTHASHPPPKDDLEHRLLEILSSNDVPNS